MKETKFNKSVYQRVAIEAVIYKAYQAAIKKLPIGSNFKFHAVLRVSGAQDGNFTLRTHTFSKQDFLSWFNETIERINAHFQSYKSLENTTFDCDFFFTVVPAGGANGGTEDRSSDSIFAKTSVLRIQNNDNACFWHGLAVLLNKDHEESVYIRKGRPIREELARELCERCSMKWDEPVAVESFEKIEQILKCNLYLLNADSLPVLNRTVQLFHSLMYKSQFVFGYTQCWLLLNGEHYDVITNPKGFLACKYFCEKCCSCFSHGDAYDKHSCNEEAKAELIERAKCETGPLCKDAGHFLKRAICKGSDD